MRVSFLSQFKPLQLQLRVPPSRALTRTADGGDRRASYHVRESLVCGKNKFLRQMPGKEGAEEYASSKFQWVAP